MNLRLLENKTLLTQTENLVREERRITTSILWHLHEIDRRKLFAELGFGSLFDYCTKHLRYSEGSAQRRISAMRLLREVPEIESKINAGTLNVSALSQAQSIFRQAKIENKAFALEEKKVLLEKLENKSLRECEKILAEISPVAARRVQEKVLSPTTTEIRFEADELLYAKLQRLKQLYAHRLKGSSNYKYLINLMADIAIEAAEPKAPKRNRETDKENSLEEATTLETRELQQAGVAVPALAVGVKRSTSAGTVSRYIPKRVKHAAWKKAQGQCSFVSNNGRRCSSRFALEFDHQRPLALGGTTEENNIRLLCRVHNVHASIQAFGLRRMERYLAQTS